MAAMVLMRAPSTGNRSRRCAAKASNSGAPKGTSRWSEGRDAPNMLRARVGGQRHSRRRDTNQQHGDREGVAKVVDAGCGRRVAPSPVLSRKT